MKNSVEIQSMNAQKERIKEAVELGGKNYKELAEYLGMKNQSDINYMSRNGTKSHQKYLHKIALFCDVSVEYLEGGISSLTEIFSYKDNKFDMVGYWGASISTCSAERCVLSDDYLYMINNTEPRSVTAFYLFGERRGILTLVERRVTLNEIIWSTKTGLPPEKMTVLGEVTGFIKRSLINEKIQIR